MWNGVSQDAGGRLKCKISGLKTSSRRNVAYRPAGHHANDCSQLGSSKNTRITHTAFVISHQTAETIIETTWDSCSVLMERLDSKFPMRFLRLFQGPRRPELSALRNSITWRLRDNYCASNARIKGGVFAKIVCQNSNHKRREESTCTCMMWISNARRNEMDNSAWHL